jgi:hypothetical protein
MLALLNTTRQGHDKVNEEISTLTLRSEEQSSTINALLDRRDFLDQIIFSGGAQAIVPRINDAEISSIVQRVIERHSRRTIHPLGHSHYPVMYNLVESYFSKLFDRDSSYGMLIEDLVDDALAAFIDCNNK